MDYRLDDRHSITGRGIFLFPTTSRPEFYPRTKAAGTWSWPLTSN